MRVSSPILSFLVLTVFATPALPSPFISEFMADNDTVLQDEDGEYSDWIEIHNPDQQSIDLAGYHLTDDSANLTKWTFPATSLAAGGYLVVFASGKNRTPTSGALHTNFKLSADGEYLALVAPGDSVLQEIAPAVLAHLHLAPLCISVK